MSSPEPKAQVSFSDQICLLSIVVVVNFHIFIFSRTTEPISSKLGTTYVLGEGGFKFLQIRTIHLSKRR